MRVTKKHVGLRVRVRSQPGCEVIGTVTRFGHDYAGTPLFYLTSPSDGRTRWYWRWRWRVVEVFAG